MSQRPSALQHLVSLDLPDERDETPDGTLGSMAPPHIKVQPPASMPSLRWLHFGSHRAWDALHEALWPLVLLAAQTAPEHAAESGASAAAAAAMLQAPNSP